MIRQMSQHAHSEIIGMLPPRRQLDHPCADAEAKWNICSPKCRTRRGHGSTLLRGGNARRSRGE